MRLRGSCRLIATILPVLSGTIAAVSATPSKESTAATTGPTFPGQTWAQATPESQGVDGAGLRAALEDLGHALGDFGGIDAVFIVRNGHVIHSGPDSDEEHQIFSATKSFTSTALGLLIQDGNVSLNTLARDLDPALTEHYPTVTLRPYGQNAHAASR